MIKRKKRHLLLANAIVGATFLVHWIKAGAVKESDNSWKMIKFVLHFTSDEV